tara:strand:+ start:1495 stop:1884 length:390 start_codon:yes stop_codon:yes gene_type:complete
MRFACVAIGFGIACAGCSQPAGSGDIPGVYSGTLENGDAYRLELGEAFDYRFCRPRDTQCADPAHLGSYEVLRLGAKSIVRFPLLCIAPDGSCKTYEADATRGSDGAVELNFVDAAGTSRVFTRVSQAD